jgi:hypothetical protein
MMNADLDKLLLKYREFDFFWDDFNKFYGSSDLFCYYLNLKVKDLERDLEALRKKIARK